MHLLEHHQPYLFQSLLSKNSRQFNQSPIISIAQIFMQEQRKLEKRKETTET